MKRILVFTVIGFGLLAMGCDHSSDSGKANGSQPLPKLEPGQLAQFRSVVEAELTASAAVMALVQSVPRNMVLTSEIQADQAWRLQAETNPPMQGEELRKMVELLKNGGCQSTNSESKYPGGSDKILTFGSQNCPVNFATNLHLVLDQSSGTVRLTGRAGYEVKSGEYKKLNDVDSALIDFSGMASRVERAKTDQTHFEMSGEGVVHSQLQSQMKSNSRMVLDAETLKDQSDGSLSLELSHRLTFVDFVGEIRFLIEQARGEKRPRARAWINGDEVDMGQQPGLPPNFDKMMNRPSLFEMNLLRVKLEQRLLSQVAI